MQDPAVTRAVRAWATSTICPLPTASQGPRGAALRAETPTRNQLPPTHTAWEPPEGCLPQAHLQAPVGEAGSCRWARGLRDRAQVWVRGGGSRAVVRVPERDGQPLSSLRQEPGPQRKVQVVGQGSGQRSEPPCGWPQAFLQHPEQHPGPVPGARLRMSRPAREAESPNVLESPTPPPASRGTRTASRATESSEGGAAGPAPPAPSGGPALL